MEKIKAVFFDVKNYEEDYIKEHMPEGCDIKLIKKPFQDVCESNVGICNEAEIVSVFTCSRLKEQDLKHFPNLKLVTTRSTGFSHIDVDYCSSNGIPVVNVPRYGDRTVAEFAFGLLLNVARHINVAYEDLQKGSVNTHKYIGIDLFGKTIGIIGTGAIGAYAATIARGFGMNVIAYDPYPKQELVDDLNVKYVSLDELYANSDIISLHAPSTKENFHMVNDEAFSKMKKGVIIINTARGEIMDTEALYKSIMNGKVAGAGLDVVECEEILSNEELYLAKIDCVNQECLAKTLLNHKLLDLPNVIVTPHVAFDSKEAIDRILATTVENIQAFVNGQVVNRVN